MRNFSRRARASRPQKAGILLGRSSSSSLDSFSRFIVLLPQYNPIGPSVMMSRWTAMNGTKNKKCCHCNHQLSHLFLIHLLLIFGEEIQGFQHNKESLPGSTTFNDPSKTAVLPVLALLDLSSADGKSPTDGASLLKTAQTAVAEVNARQLIPGHHLQLLVNDSKVYIYVSFKKKLFFCWPLSF